MEYTSIHVNGHLLSDEILRSIEQDETFQGNTQRDFAVDTTVGQAIDYAWGALRNDWEYFKSRSNINDPYGTRRVRDLMSALFAKLGYNLEQQRQNVEASGRSFDITYLDHDIKDFPIKAEGFIIGDADLDTLDRNSLDYRAKGQRRQKSHHATMLEYLNSTENVYGIVTNGYTLRLIRNSGQLVKMTYIEFDLRRMIEEDKYSEFRLMFRFLHASRFRVEGDEPCIFERWFNLSIESGNRIRSGLSKAVQKAMEKIGTAAVCGSGKGNEALRQAIASGELTAKDLNSELVHFIYRLLFLFIIEDRNLVYELPPAESPDYKEACRNQEIYNQYYAASRFRSLSELRYLYNREYSDLWEGLIETFRLFEPGSFGDRLGIKPLGGVLFGSETLHWLKQVTISNRDILEAFSALNIFIDEKGNPVKINYSALDVEEFGSVYEGILEMTPRLTEGSSPEEWLFDYAEGLDRKSSSSYYTRPDLVQSLIHTTLEPVIKERLSICTTTEQKEKTLLSMKVCDAASGSGHIVLAMARTIAWYLCSVRTGEDNPASLDYRRALREVIQKCVYAVDYNPDAVELCKVVLWIEGYCAGQPLSFLDHHIRCGNSVVGVADLDKLLEGVPQEAFSKADKEGNKIIKRLNADALKDIKILLDDARNTGLQVSLFDDGFNISRIDNEQISLADNVREISSLPETTLLEELTKKRRWTELMESPRVECLRRACDIYTYAFYKDYTEDELIDNSSIKMPMVPFSRTVYQALEDIKQLENPSVFHTHLSEDFKTEVAEAARLHRFFHWAVEFPEVFADGGGFDVMCGNPPWDKIKVEDKKWFEANGRPDIVNAGTAAQRKRAIEELPITDPELFARYTEAQKSAEGMSRFVRFAERFPLTATGDIDLYPMFAELCLNFSKLAWGLVVPTGIAVNDSNKAFFSKLIDDNRLISMYSFENEEKIFDIHHSFKFCLLTAGERAVRPRNVQSGFYLRRMDHLLDPRRIYTLRTSDFARLNPNTKTCPVFRTSRDAELTAKIYRNSQILVNEVTGENPWEVKFGSMIHMSNDSHLFRTYAQLTESGAKIDERNHFFLPDGTEYVPLYEGKMFYLYNHLYGSWPTDGERPNVVEITSIDSLTDVDESIKPWYWIPASECENRLIKYDKEGNVVWEWKHNWLMAWRDVTNASTERSFIVASIPDTDGSAVGVGNTATLLEEQRGSMPGALLLAMLSTLIFDYAARQKIGGTHASIGYVKQFPVIPPEQIPDEWVKEIVPRVLELTHFNHDMDGWAREIGEEWDALREEKHPDWPELQWQEPVRFDPERRAVLQAELDAIFAHLYGLNEEDLRYILDPEDVCGPGCINQTFRVLKDRELRELGEYRTRRLVLSAWHRFHF